MKVAFINGSPKFKESTSGLILNELKSFLKEPESVSEYFFRKTFVDGDDIKSLSECDALVFAFPLYVDGIPSHLLSCLIQLEGYFKNHHKSNVKVYGIVNSGFYEGKQNELAIEMLENWCYKAGFTWGQGLGIGAGMMLQSVMNVPMGHGPKKNLGEALKALGENISKGNTCKDLCITANFPRFLYKVSGNYNWKQIAKKNGVKPRELSRRL